MIVIVCKMLRDRNLPQKLTIEILIIDLDLIRQHR